MCVRVARVAVVWLPAKEIVTYWHREAITLSMFANSEGSAVLGLDGATLQVSGPRLCKWVWLVRDDASCRQGGGHRNDDWETHGGFNSVLGFLW